MLEQVTQWEFQNNAPAFVSVILNHVTGSCKGLSVLYSLCLAQVTENLVMCLNDIGLLTFVLSLHWLRWSEF